MFLLFLKFIEMFQALSLELMFEGMRSDITDFLYLVIQKVGLLFVLLRVFLIHF